jgi:hypothetical protein
MSSATGSIRDYHQATGNTRQRQAVQQDVIGRLPAAVQLKGSFVADRAAEPPGARPRQHHPYLTHTDTTALYRGLEHPV